MMIRLLMTLAIVLTGVVVAYWLLAEPKLLLDQAEIVVPPVERGGNHEVQVELHNAGRSTLRLGPIQTSCACTSAITDREQVAAGQTAVLKITVASHSQDAAEVLIHSNDPDQPVRLLKLLFPPADPIRLRPARLDFGIVSRDELPLTLTSELTIYDPDWRPDEIRFETDQTDDEFSVEARPVSEGRMKVRVTLQPHVARAANGFVHISRGDSGVSIPVLAKVR